MKREKAYAKINLFLNVVSRRTDGYHELEMVMAPLKLHDTLTFKRVKERNIIVKSNKEITKNTEDNIVFKVAHYLMENFDVHEGVEIFIEKRIPQGGGLGGGSADAAATLRGLNKLWKLDLSKDDMAQIGVQFGADIPFCVYNKMAIARGIGEQLTFIKSKFRPHVLLVNPNIEVATKTVFQNLNQDDFEQKSVSKIVEALQTNEFTDIVSELYNHLETSTFDLHPVIREIKNSIIDSGLKGTLMSGSGATVFAVCIDKQKVQEVSKSLNKDYFNILTKLHQ